MAPAGTSDPAPAWLARAVTVVLDVLLAGGIVGWGLYAGRPGPVVGGIGWGLVTIPLYYRQHRPRGVPRWAVALGLVGGLAIVCGIGLQRTAS